jgi:phage-related protein
LIDLLEREGVGLSEPYTRQLRGKLRELRFYLGRERYRITYYVAKGRRIILLTIFKKSARKELAEIARAEGAMARCVGEGHIAEETDDAE